MPSRLNFLDAASSCCPLWTAMIAVVPVGRTPPIHSEPYVPIGTQDRRTGNLPVTAGSVELSETETMLDELRLDLIETGLSEVLHAQQLRLRSGSQLAETVYPEHLQGLSRAH